MKRALFKDITRSHGLFFVDYHDPDELEEYTESQQFRLLSLDYYNPAIYASEATA